MNPHHISVPRLLTLAISLLLLGGGLYVADAGDREHAAEPAGSSATNDPPPTPVLVELFTSEGCSSCPPADRLLGILETSQSVRGAEIIVLSEHVDYWDRLGWKDRFSSPEFSERQRAYSRSLGSGAYTPQMVVDGSGEFIGSDARAARNIVAHVAQYPKADVNARLRPAAKKGSPRTVSLEIEVNNIPEAFSGEPLSVMLAITENGLETAVGRGENSGRHIKHTGVVRQLRTIGRIKQKNPGRFSTVAKVKHDPGWNHENLRAVVFVQGERSGRVAGVGAVSLRMN